jgi:hypothetical protein
MGKKSRSGSGVNIPDHISESLETIFWVKILKLFVADADPDPVSGNLFDPGSGMEKIRIRDKHPGSATLLLPLPYIELIESNIPPVLCVQQMGSIMLKRKCR